MTLTAVVVNALWCRNGLPERAKPSLALPPVAGMARQVARSDALQFGPQRAAPGARLKVEKT
jgi:hypothetical protein